MRRSLRNTGIEPVGTEPWGTHFCHFYETTNDLLDTVLPFFKAGLEANEFCAWVVSEPVTENGAWQALDRAIPRLDRYVSERSIEVLNARDVYLAGGKIDRHRIMANWNDKLSAALSRRYQGIRASGNIAWLGHEQWPDFMEYEAEVTRAASGKAMLLLCTYPLLSSAAIDDVTRTHQFGIAKCRGRWEAVTSRPLSHSSRTGTSGVVRETIKRTWASLATYAHPMRYPGRCIECGRGFLAGTGLRWCVSGHTLHQACVKHALGREVCPICGIYVSESPPSSSRS